MYITINDIKGSKRIDLTYPIHSGKEIGVISLLSNNIQYEIIKHFTIIDDKTKTYTGRELLSLLEGMMELRRFENDDRVTKMNKLRGITEMSLNLDELDYSDNLEDGRPSYSLLNYHVTSNEDFMSFEPYISQYKKLKNGEIVFLTLRIMDQNNNIITDSPWVTVVLHICDLKI